MERTDSPSRSLGAVASIPVADRVAIGLGVLAASGFLLLPLVAPGVTHLAAVVVVLIALYAGRFGLVGGLGAAGVGAGLAVTWLLEGVDAGTPVVTLAVQVCLFVAIGWLAGSVVSRHRRYEVAVRTRDEMSNELICTASFDGFFTALNPAWTHVLGWRLDELMARPYDDFIHPDDLTDTMPEVVRRTWEGLDVVNFENRYRCRDGSYRWLEWTARRDPRTRTLHGVARDITARREVDEQLSTLQGALELAVSERTAELEERTSELEESRRETLRRLALAAEFRDDETFEHTERVGWMAAELATRLGISAGQADLLRWAAPLHDVGKLALSDSIVLKPGRLTHAETAEVRKHPENGARILANSKSDVLQLAEQIALGHHEWWDGSGYPNGLRGDAIPYCARIVAVADVFDALTHARPYKAAWSIAEAIAEIALLGGRQFDPAVVEAFLQLSLERVGGPAPDRPAYARLTTYADVAPGGSRGTDQTAADAVQHQTNAHQSASDAHQVVADSAQARADDEQYVSDRDQGAADSQLARNPGTRLTLALEASRSERAAATKARDAATARRDAATVERDAATAVRDAATVERDAASRERHSSASARSRTTAERIATADRRDEVARLRDLTAAARDRAARARPGRAAAAEALARGAAESDRNAAAADRLHAAADRSYASLDELTGVLRRGAGELALTHEIDRACRSGRTLVVVVVDIDGLKAVNDTYGHAAGDALLHDVPTAITSALRSYDITVRWGGDEFVCGLSDIGRETAVTCFAEIQLALAGRTPPAWISFGVAELAAGDTVESLIARADANLYRAKTARHPAATGRV